MLKHYQVSIIIFILGFMVILSFVMPEFMQVAAIIILGGVGFLLTIAAIWLAVRLYLSLADQYWQKEQKKRHVIVAPLGQQVFVEVKKDTHFHALHLDQRTYSNGRYEPPLPEEAQAWLHFHRPSKSQAQLVAGMQSANPKPQLLPLLKNSWKIFLVGNEGAGKTTLLKALMNQRLQQGPVVVVDIHGNKQHWPGAKVIGTGYNLDEVTLTFDRIVAEIKRRYRLIADNPNASQMFQPITVICDEFTALVLNLAQVDYDLSSFMRMMSTEVRKTKVSFIFASHVETLAGTGLTGAAKLIDSFVKVKLFYDAINGERQYTIDLNDGNGEQEVDNILPLQSGLMSQSIDLDLPEPDIDSVEKKVMDFINKNEEYTRRQLVINCLNVKVGRIGSQHYRQIDKVLNRLNRAGLITS